MRHLSIRSKITLWFSALTVVIVALTYAVIFSVSGSVMQKTVRDNLIVNVEHNVDEVEFFGNYADAENDNDRDHYIQSANGVLEIDDDFLDVVNGVCTALYSSDGTLMYGENPITRNTSGLPFTDLVVQRVRVSGVLYYVFDRRLEQEGLEGLWLRGVVSEKQGMSQTSDIARFSLYLLPLIMFAAVAGCWFMAGKMLRPLRDITGMAEKINHGGDLKKKIDIGPGSDELHTLADTFNGMFSRLDDAFENERQFASDASHELRTPTSVILAQCEYTLENERSTEEYENALTIIKRQANRMSKLISDMLDFLRLERRIDAVPFENVDMTGLTRSVCEDMALISENGITLVCKAQDGVSINGNKGLLSRLIVNLISNAYRYGNENGHIYVNLTQADGETRLSVEDDGIGIAPEIKDKIFERFYRADKSRSSKGAGLGLSMAAQIATLHGGKIELESEPGKGSVFTFVIK